MPIWMLTDLEFHGVLVPTCDNDIGWEPLQPIAAAAIADSPDATRRPLPHAPGYEYIWTVDGDIFAVEIASGDAVGIKNGEFITADPGHRGKGLGPGLVVAAYTVAPWPLNPTLPVTNRGARALRTAHELEVRAAHAAGQPVPVHVKAIYGLP